MFIDQTQFNQKNHERKTSNIYKYRPIASLYRLINKETSFITRNIEIILLLKNIYLFISNTYIHDTLL